MFQGDFFRYCKGYLEALCRSLLGFQMGEFQIRYMEFEEF